MVDGKQEALSVAIVERAVKLAKFDFILIFIHNFFLLSLSSIHISIGLPYNKFSRFAIFVCGGWSGNSITLS